LSINQNILAYLVYDRHLGYTEGHSCFQIKEENYQCDSSNWKRSSLWSNVVRWGGCSWSCNCNL